VTEPIVEVTGVSKRYRRTRTRVFGHRPTVEALDDVTVHVGEHQRVGIVGESGSGKSTLARLLVGLERPTGGTVRVGGIEVPAARGDDLRRLRRTVQMVFQDPMGSLDPRNTVATIVAEPLVGLDIGSPGERAERVREVLEEVGLDAGAARRYPHEFSGGQRQRIAIARALAPRPRVLVADEPVSALDVSVRNQVLNLLLELTDELGLTLVFISHDLSVVRHLCPTVVVLHDGRVVEQGATEHIYAAPSDPYTEELVAAIPTLAGSLTARRARREATSRSGPAGTHDAPTLAQEATPR
jgi:peptide/nickel transport system ATP-binding protein